MLAVHLPVVRHSAWWHADASCRIRSTFWSDPDTRTERAGSDNGTRTGAEKKSAQLESQLAALRQTCTQAQSDHMATQAQLEKEAYLHNQMQSRREEEQQQHKQLTQRLHEATQKCEAAKQEQQQLGDAITQAQASLEQHEDERVQMQQKQSALADKRAQLHIAKVELEKDMENADA